MTAAQVSTRSQDQVAPTGTAATADTATPQPWLGNKTAFALVFCVVNLHVLMNISTAGYLLVYVAVTGWLVQRAVRARVHRRLRGHGALFVVWVAIALMAGVTSLGVISPFGAVYGTIRFLFAAPIFIALATFTDTYEDLAGHVRTMVIGFTVAALTLPMQFITGPISWFDEPSLRGTQIRYASLVGSLTSIGIAVGCYLVLAAVLRRQAITVAALMSVAAALSLSKAAIANIIIGWALILYFNRHRPLVMLAAGIGVPLAAIAAYVGSPGIKIRVDTVLSSFGVQSAAGADNYDVSFLQSIVDRLTDLPAENWAALETFRSDLVYLSGGGYGMGDTALVTAADSTAPMAHNQFIESMSVFGLVGGTIQWLVLLCIAVTLVSAWRRSGNQLVGITALAFLVLLLNSLLANGVYYQPSTASVLFFAMFVAQARISLDPAPGAPGTTPPPAQPKRGIRMQINEIVATVMRRWITFVVVGLLVGGAIFAVLSTRGSSSDDSGSGSQASLMFALAPTGDTVAELKDASDYISAQSSYWAQLAASEAVMEQLDDDLDVETIRDQCSNELIGTNVWQLTCSATGDDDAEAYVEKWAAASQDAILATSSEVSPPVEFQTIGDVEGSEGLAAAGSNVAILALPMAAIIAAVAALLAALAHDAVARRRKS